MNSPPPEEPLASLPTGSRRSVIGLPHRSRQAGVDVTNGPVCKHTSAPATASRPSPRLATRSGCVCAGAGPDGLETLTARAAWLPEGMPGLPDRGAPRGWVASLVACTRKYTHRAGTPALHRRLISRRDEPASARAGVRDRLVVGSPSFRPGSIVGRGPCPGLAPQATRRAALACRRARARAGWGR